MRRIFRPKRDEVTGGWRNLHNDGLHDLYCLPNIITIIKSNRMRWAGHLARMGEKRNAYMSSVGKPEGRGSQHRLRRPVDNIKLDLGDIGCDGVVWTGLVWLKIGRSGGLLWMR
jgi:hypothetical protein